ncbi:MAG: NusG domain II-containing protein [Raoultibacter sp.]
MRIVEEKRRTLIFGGIIVAIVALCLIALATLQTQPTPSKAVITKAGTIIKTIDLSQVDQPYTFRVADEYGYNDIAVEHGRIRVIEANCPDKVCVAFGWTQAAGTPIACLPHRLTITLEGGETDGKIDARTR